MNMFGTVAVFFAREDPVSESGISGVIALAKKRNEAPQL